MTPSRAALHRAAAAGPRAQGQRRRWQAADAAAAAEAAEAASGLSAGAGRRLGTAAAGSPAALLTTTFHEQLRGITYDTVPGPGRQLRWGAPPGRHDDLVLSLALVSALDGFDWRERIAHGEVRREL